MTIHQVLILFCFLKYTKESQIIEFLEEGHCKQDMPLGRPVQVNASMNLRNIISVSEKEHTISLEITLRMFWRDDRLSFNRSGNLSKDRSHYNLSYYAQTKKLKDIWIPDLFVDEALKVRNPAFKIPTESLRLYEDNSLRFSKRFNFDVACRMDFQNYPVDTQDCIVHLESHSYTNEDLVFKWLGKDHMNENPNISLSHYYYTMITGEYETQTKNMHSLNESHPGLDIKIRLKRKTHVHFIQDLLPSFLYVWIAYFGVLMPSDEPAVRTSLVLFPMLHLTTLTNKIRTDIPAVAVLTFMDIWLTCCLVFIFSSVVLVVSSMILSVFKKEDLLKKTELWFKVFYPAIFTTLCIVHWSVLRDSYLS